MKKLFLAFLVIFASISIVFPKITNAALLDYFFGSNNRVEIVYQVGFRIHYGCTAGGGGCDGVSGTYFENVNSTLGSFNRIGAGTVNPLPGTKWQHMQWGTACLDPSVKLSQYDDPTNPGTEYTTGTVNITCNEGNPLCFLTDAAERQYANQGGGWLAFTGYYNTSNCPVYCGAPSCVGRCGTFRNDCGHTVSPQVSCGGCPDGCGTGADRCHWYTETCNASNYCAVSNVSRTDPRCRPGGLGGTCSYNSDCDQSTQYCKNADPCGTCRLYDEIQGRVFVDVNRNNEWDGGTDVGLPNASVQRAITGTANWPVAEGDRWIRTNANGWFVWGPAFQLRDINNQDVRIRPFEFGLYEPPVSCDYTNIIRSRYGGIGTVEASNAAGEYGHRRNDIDPDPTPTSILFMLRYKEYQLSGTVYTDSNKNRVLDPVPAGGDLPYNNTGVLVRAERPAGTFFGNDFISAAGEYIIPNPVFNNQTYDVILNVGTLPNNYEVIGNSVEGVGSPTPNTLTTTVNCANSINNFLIGRIYSISGQVFIDLNGNGRQDAGEANTTANFSIDGNPAVPTAGNGTFLFERLPEGSHTVTLTSIPALWEATYPITPIVGVQPSATVTVGTGCDVSAYNSGLPGAPHGASCTTIVPNEDNVINLTFGIRPIPPEPWTQGTGGDMRADNGNDLINKIPNDPASLFAIAYGLNPNPYFSIVQDILEPGLIFGNGLTLGPLAIDNYTLANTVRQYVNLPFAQNTRDTSFTSVSQNLEKNGINTTPIANTTMSANPGAGNYLRTGNLRIDNGANPVVFDSGKYIFLINGDLEINSNISVPVGSVAVFIVSGDIIVAETVTSIQGLISTDEAFTIEGNDADKTLNNQLNIQGSVVALNGFGNGRDLDYRNINTPSVFIRFRPDFVINAPPLVRFSDYKIFEIAPGEGGE